MAVAPVEKALGALTGARLFACVADHGSAAHPYQSSQLLLRGPQSSRNLADAVHFLSTVHGRYPGVIDHAVTRTLDPAARAWFTPVLEGFSEERAFLARLAVEVGPAPSTPGHASAEAMLLSQRHALDMLAQSERNGCALGAAMALVVDWGRIRGVLNVAANRFGVEPPAYRLTDTGAVHRLADTMGAAPLVERALLFGAEQVMLQHHGLWDLLEARAMARADR
ncbi:MAG TPA: hypothetical protein VGD10_00635 [Allosphingosinicella sp.]|uniref:DUF6975 family protein n=1 Tax=Allosphingosinicella sp. TaxID=2823234 RepID=UPI002ED784F4